MARENIKLTVTTIKTTFEVTVQIGSFEEWGQLKDKMDNDATIVSWNVVK